METKFLAASTIYRGLQRELPEDVYPDGAPSSFFSTADSFATAQVVGDAYTNLQRIYANYFPQSTDERLSDWEIKVFGKNQDASLSMADRIARIITKIQKIPSLSLWNILTLAASYVPVGTYVQIVEWGNQKGGGGNWILGTSKLNVNTYLTFGLNSSLGNVSDYCALVKQSGFWRLGSSRLGVDTKFAYPLNYQTISAAQAKAYTYELRIFNYTVSGTDLANLLSDMNAQEPARSGHIIKQNQNLAAYGLTNPVQNVDQFSLVNAITRSNTSTTGYDGITPA